SMYDTEGAFPVQVGAQSLTTTIIGIAEQPIPWFLLYPNPTADGWVTLSANGESMKELSIYTMSGQFVERVSISAPISRIQLPEQSGVYLIEITTQSGKQQLQRIIRE
ncbi:MAG: T9SS type A sorting domain-containing protein, partial [Bacteroidota bacterium]